MRSGIAELRRTAEGVNFDEMPMADLAQALGKSKPSRHVRDVVRRLVAAGDIAYMVPDRPRSRFQQYRLTGQGQRRIGRG